MNRTLTVLCAVFGVALLFSCGGPSAEMKKAERERLAGAQARLEQLESKLAGSGDQRELALESLRSIIGIQVMELDAPKAGIDRFEANQALLEQDLMTRIYLAVAQAKMAGVSKKIEDKLSWLRLGMASFESLREDYPDDETVYLYQASTYAFFPAEVGAKADVLDILSDMLQRYRSGEWRLSAGVAGQLTVVFASLDRTYPDKESNAEIEELRSAFRTELPAFEAAYGRVATGDGRE